MTREIMKRNDEKERMLTRELITGCIVREISTRADDTRMKRSLREEREKIGKMCNLELQPAPYGWQLRLGGKAFENAETGVPRAATHSASGPGGKRFVVMPRDRSQAR
jgi:hypothetical protein